MTDVECIFSTSACLNQRFVVWIVVLSVGVGKKELVLHRIVNIECDD